MAIRTVEELVTKWKLDTSKFVRKAGELNREIDKSISKTEGAQKMFQRVGGAATKAGSLLTAGLTLPIAAFGIASIKASSDFQFAMNKARALTGATDAELAKLAEQAKYLGRTTQFSASQAAESINFLGLAGFKTNEIMEALPQTLALAGAANLEMAQAADIQAKALKGFGFEADQAGRVADTLTQAFTMANTDLQGLGDALKFVGPIAKGLGQDFEDMVAGISIMSDAGIQGTMAGTSLRTALSSLAKPTATARKELKKYGLSVEDVDPSVHGLVDIIEKMSAAGIDMKSMLKIMEIRAVPGFGAAMERGADDMNKFANALRGAKGRADEINAVMVSGARGSVVKLKSALEGLFIAIGESGLLDAFTELVTKLTDVVSWMAEASPRTLKWLTILGALLAALGPLLLIFGQFALAAAGVLQLTAALSALGVTMATVTGIAATLWAVFWPIGLITAAVLALRYSIKNFGDEWAAVGVSFGRILKKMMSWIAQLGMQLVKAILWPFEWLAKLGGTSLMDGVNEAIGEVKDWSAGTVDPSAIMAERNLAKRGVDNFGRPISAPSNGGGGNNVNVQVTREGDQFVVPNADPRAVAEESRRIAAEKDRDLGRSIRTDMLAGY